MERKRKFTATCAEIKSELKAMDPLNVGIYEDDQESIEEHKKKLKQMQIKLRDAASAYENITTRYNSTRNLRQNYRRRIYSRTLGARNTSLRRPM